MEKKDKVRTKWHTLRLSTDEQKKLLEFARRTTAASLSEYAWNVLLKEPVTILYRNQSADEFLSEMLLLKKELNAIGNNFNQVVHTLHTLDHIPDIREWTALNEKARQTFMEKVNEIQEKLNQIYYQWLQK